MQGCALRRVFASRLAVLGRSGERDTPGLLTIVTHNRMNS